MQNHGHGGDGAQGNRAYAEGTESDNIGDGLSDFTGMSTPGQDQSDQKQTLRVEEGMGWWLERTPDEMRLARWIKRYEGLGREREVSQ